MDPVSQAVLGGLAAQVGAQAANLKKAGIMGAIAGMAADLDVLIRSSSDPLLALEYHRHFTHSLVFVPIGGLLCALALHLLLSKRWRLSFKQSYLWCTLGYASHALLDAFTSYGTQLYWPFSDTRIAWDTISVIDPSFTLPLLALAILACIKQKHRYTAAAVLWLTIYISLGFVQYHRAVGVGETLAAERGHTPSSVGAKPSFANITVWKTIYEFEGRFYIDAVKPKRGGAIIWEGGSVQKLAVARDFPWLDSSSQQALDVARFTHFSAGFVALDPNVPNRIIDMRYSMLPNEIDALWGIDLNPNATNTEHIRNSVIQTERLNALQQLWQMLRQ